MKVTCKPTTLSVKWKGNVHIGKFDFKLNYIVDYLGF